MKTGESELKEALVALSPEMLSWVLQRTGSPDLAEEVVQEALTKGLEKLSRLENPRHLKAWFRTIVRNTLIDELRYQQRQEPLENLAAPETPELPDEEEGCACILEIMKQVRPGYAQLLQAVDIDEKPVQTVAREQGLSPNNASVRLHRARQALRRQLAQTCGTDSLQACLNCSCPA